MKDFLYQLQWVTYRLPLWSVWLIIAAAVILWGLAGRWLTKKAPKLWRGVNIVVLLCSAAAIVYLTLLHRGADKQLLELLPFHSFIEAKQQREIYRTLTMNVFLFVPFGLTFPFVFPGNNLAKTVAATVITALVISVGIEILQYALCLGKAETDDVLCNIIGAAAGAVAILFHPQKNNLHKKTLLWHS